ncbi:transcriptional regulator [Devosia sp.]|uniref:transcriptional regulator n=1 Tax=Devosia sp. TaxID=1871048 RepID=UPI002B0003D0|nr:Cro/CI family transcriptional regulator [Devosia sp.]
MLKIVEIAAKKSGGIVALASQLGVAHQTLYSWRQIPPERVIDMERITGISRHELRPDLSRIFVERSEASPSPQRASA